MKFSPTSKKSAFWLGYRDNIPFWLIVAPFGLLFGVVATEAGFSIFQTMIMTAFVVAGSSQFTALTLLQDDAPTFIIFNLFLKDLLQIVELVILPIMVY